jgi:hypothetical protein
MQHNTQGHAKSDADAVFSNFQMTAKNSHDEQKYEAPE